MLRVYEQLAAPGAATVMRSHRGKEALGGTRSPRLSRGDGRQEASVAS